MSGPVCLTGAQLARDLAVPDLSDPADGPHAIQLLAEQAAAALTGAWGCGARWCRGPRVVTIAGNYDHLGYEPAAVTREARYTRYVEASACCAATPPPWCRPPCATWPGGVSHATMCCWCVPAWCTGGTHRREHPYTTCGRQVDVSRDGDWVEVWECGLADPGVLAGAGLPEVALARLGARPGQRNLLVRVVLRHLDRTLTDGEANALREARNERPSEEGRGRVQQPGGEQKQNQEPMQALVASTRPRLEP